MNCPEYWSAFPEIGEVRGIRCSRVEAGDGGQIYGLDAGPGGCEAVLIVMPTTTPFLLMLRTAALLSKHRRVISWESRGATFLDDRFSPECATVERHARDLEEVAAAMGVTAVHIVAWCSGVDVAAHAVANTALDVRSVVLIAPTLAGQPRQGKADPPFRQLFVPMLKALRSASESEGDTICRTIARFAAMRAADDETGDLLNRLTNLNLMDAARIRQYAELMGTFYDWPETADRRAAFQNMYRTVDTLLLCFEDDETVGFAWAEGLEKDSSRLTVQIDKQGGHFAPFLRPKRVAAVICGYLGQIEQRGQGLNDFER